MEFGYEQNNFLTPGWGDSGTDEIYTKNDDNLFDSNYIHKENDKDIKEHYGEPVIILSNNFEALPSKDVEIFLNELKNNNESILEEATSKLEDLRIGEGLGVDILNNFVFGKSDERNAEDMENIAPSGVMQPPSLLEIGKIDDPSLSVPEMNHVQNPMMPFEISSSSMMQFSTNYSQPPSATYLEPSSATYLEPSSATYLEPPSASHSEVSSTANSEQSTTFSSPNVQAASSSFCDVSSTSTSILPSTSSANIPRGPGRPRKNLEDSLREVIEAQQSAAPMEVVERKEKNLASKKYRDKKIDKNLKNEKKLEKVVKKRERFNKKIKDLETRIEYYRQLFRSNF